MPRHFVILCAPLLLALCACGTIKRFTPDLSSIPMPTLPKFSSLKKIGHLIPGLPQDDKIDDADPNVPFNSRGILGYGHTLRIQVFQGTRSPKRMFSGLRMIDQKGVLALGEFGSARIGGGTLPQAAETIASVFRIAGHSSKPVTVHIVSVENVPVVSITGDVRAAEFIPAWDGMTIKQAVTVAGGRRLGSEAHGVYLTRNGLKRYFSSLEGLNEREEPEPGDIITLSPDI